MSKTEPSFFPHLSEPTIVIEPHRGLLDLDLRGIWEYRELLYFLVWRDLKVRYRQISNRNRVGNTPATHDHGRLYRCLWQICWRALRRSTLSYFYLFSSVAMESLCQLFKSWECQCCRQYPTCFEDLLPPPHPTTLRCFVARGGFCHSVWHFDRNDGLVWHFTYLGDPRSSPTRTSGRLNRSRHRSLAFSIEREVPRRWPCGTVFGPNLDVHKSCDLSG